MMALFIRFMYFIDEFFFLISTAEDLYILFINLTQLQCTSKRNPPNIQTEMILT